MKLQTRVLTAAAAFMLAVAAHATPPPGFTTNSQATFYTNAIQWSLWGPGLTADGSCSGGCNAFSILTPLHDGSADVVFGTRTATWYTNTVMGPANTTAGSYFGGSTAASTDSFADQSVGFFIPPVTTNYVFFICSDDYSELYLGTDIGAASAQLIAVENSWSNPNQWTTTAGGSDIAAKRSDQFAPAGGTPPYAAGVPLVAGNMYFIEIDHENGNGGYNDEVYYKYAGAPDPKSDGTVATDMTNTPTSTVIGFVAQPATFVNVTISPSNTATFDADSTATFSVSVASDGTFLTNGAPYAAAFQWQTNGVNVTNADGSLATGPVFGYLVGSGDTGVKVTCQVTFPAIDTNVYNSSATTLTVNNTTTIVGGLKREFWANQAFGLGNFESFISGPPSYVATVTNGMGPASTGINDYQERYSGWFIPPTTGAYVFFVESDDGSDLFISTDSTPNNKYLIAQETEYANPEEWSTDEGGGVTTGTPITQKRSDMFVGPTDASPPYATGISLTAGQKYYIEADHYQGGGGDNFGMTFSLLSAANTITNGVPTAFGGNNIAFETPVGTTLTITQNPTNVAIFQGANANFGVSVTTDSPITPVFEWLVNGTNVGPGTAGSTPYTSSYAIVSPTLAANGETLQVVVTVPFTTLAATSTVATLTVNKAVTVPGLLLHEFWANQTGLPTVLVPNLGPPSYVNVLNTVETGSGGTIFNYVEIVSGYFIPPETGNYVFNLCSDDQSDLYLSTDESGANAKLIAQETAWSNANQWVDTAGGSSVPDKESDTFLGSTNGIALTAGSNYFIEAVHYQGGGGDNLGVYFWTTDQNYPGPAADGVVSDIVASNIAFVTPASTVTLVSSPQSSTVLAGNSATLTVDATSTSPISYLGSTNVFVTYQWYTNGAAVPGATTSSYTTPLLGTNDSGQTAYCIVGAIAAAPTNSATATLTVTPDPIPGGVVSAFSVLDSGGTGGEVTNQYVDILFSKSMDLASVTNPANYTIAGATITSVTLFTNNSGGDFGATMAILQLAAPLKGNFTVAMPNVLDFNGHNVTNSTLAGTVDPLTSEDIASGNVAVPGTTYYLGPGHYEVDASGVDIWNTSDSFRYVYTTRTNNFDVVVQVPYMAPANSWTKAGLMVRETIDPVDATSRMMFAIATASKTLSPAPLDGSVAEDDYSTGIRSATGTAAFSGTGLGYTFVGDGDTTVGNESPEYPNTWIRMTRTFQGTTNDVFTGYWSNDGQDWNKFCSYEPDITTNSGTAGVTADNTPFPSVVYIGMCTTAHEGSGTYQNDMGTVIYQNFGDFVAGPPPSTGPTLKASAVGSSLTISWAPTGGTLYSSPVLTTNSSSWTVVGTSNPYTTTIANGSLFFKVVQ